MRKVLWGVMGTAGIARGQTIPGMQTAENCELYAVAGRSPEKAERFRAEFGFEKAYGSYEALLADPKVEAVYIPLPNDLHYPWVLKALAAKKHVLCEKPLALNAAQAEEMFRTAEANGVYLMEAFAYLHSPFVEAVREELGTIGEPVYIESAFLGGRPGPGDYRMRREAGGGALYDLGCYPLSMALWILGKEPESVQASALYFENGVDRFVSFLLGFEGGAVADLDCGMLLRANRLDRFHIHGARGEIFSPVQFNQPGAISYTVIRDGVREDRTVTAPNNYQLEVEQLGRCILCGEKPRVSPAFSLRVARTMDRLLKIVYP